MTRRTDRRSATCPPGGGPVENPQQEYKAMQEEFLYTTKLWFAVHENSLIVDRETGRRRLKRVFRKAS